MLLLNAVSTSNDVASFIGRKEWVDNINMLVERKDLKLLCIQTGYVDMSAQAT